jgi:hypothetical protein
VTRALPLLGGSKVVGETSASHTFEVAGAQAAFVIELSASRERIASVVKDVRGACEARGLRMTPSAGGARGRRVRIVVGARPNGDACDLAVTRWTSSLATALAAELASRCG